MLTNPVSYLANPYTPASAGYDRYEYRIVRTKHPLYTGTYYGVQRATFPAYGGKPHIEWYAPDDINDKHVWTTQPDWRDSGGLAREYDSAEMLAKDLAWAASENDPKNPNIYKVFDYNGRVFAAYQNGQVRWDTLLLKPNPYTPQSAQWPRYELRTTRMRDGDWAVDIAKWEPGSTYPKIQRASRYGFSEWLGAMNEAHRLAEFFSNTADKRNPNAVRILNDTGRCEYMWWRGELYTCTTPISVSLQPNPWTSPYDKHQIRIQRDADGLWWIHLYTEPGGGGKPTVQTYGGYDGWKAYQTTVDFALKLAKDLRARDSSNPNTIKVYDENGLTIAEL